MNRLGVALACISLIWMLGCGGGSPQQAAPTEPTPQPEIYADDFEDGSVEEAVTEGEESAAPGAEEGSEQSAE